ncbi:DUF2859 domain-containing protein [Salmonella enterica subsp. salamae]|nr:DUF2859 domain-containing protein [Salmonella enterica subsp. salamae]
MKHLIPAMLLFTAAAIAEPAVPMQALDEARLLPVITHNLHPGQQPRLALNLPGMTPLFLIGDDMAKHLPITAYPVLITDKGLAQ